MVRAVILGAGYVASHLAAGLTKIKKGEVEPYGVPLARYDLPVKIEDIEIVAAYDVDNAKVGKTLYDVAVEVFKGTGHSVPEELKNIPIRRGIHLGSARVLPVEAKGLEDEVGIKEAIERLVKEWCELKPEVFVNVITTEEARKVESKEEFVEKALKGELSATQTYAYAVAEYVKRCGKAAFVNAIPTPVANSPGIVEYFKEIGAVLFGDDGATGATPLTADLLEHMAERNRRVLFIVQFNIGGNTDFLALTDPKRNAMKETTKSSMVEDILGYDAPHFIKPTGYLEPLGDKKYVAMHLEYISFGGFKDSIYINARINDSPALAGMLTDLIRLGKIAIDRGAVGTVYEVNAFFMKKPGPDGSRNIARSHAYLKLLEWLGLSGY